MRIPDRGEAGRLLAHVVSRHDFDDPVVIGLGSGGLVVGAEVARTLHCPLDILDAEELGTGDPLHPSRAFAALSGGGHLLIRPETLDRIRGGQALRDAVSRARRPRGGRGSAPSGRGGTVPTSWRTVILVDDGTSSRDTVVAAVDLVRAGRPGRVIVALPAAPQESLDELEHLVGEVISRLCRAVDGVVPPPRKPVRGRFGSGRRAGGVAARPLTSLNSGHRACQGCGEGRRRRHGRHRSGLPATRPI